MRFDVTLEIDDNLIEESGMQPDEYIRQEMGWLEDSGITLTDTAVSREQIDLPAILKGMTGAEALEYLEGQRQEQADTPEITGNDGIYLLGNAGGKEYVANVFRSDAEPGYLNFGLFAIQGDQMEIVESGFYDGYESIEDCVRDLAADGTMLNVADIRFVAHCSWEINSMEEYREALNEGRLEEPVPVPSWDQIILGDQVARDNAEQGKPSGKPSDRERETFYFSFGTSEHFPHQMGWVEVRAKDRMEACEMFSSHYPKHDGLINCAFVYDEREWRRAGMDRENALGHVCHQTIDSWGPHAEHGRARAELLAAGFDEGLVDERSDVPRQITPEMGAKLLGLHYRMEDMKGLCPGVFWCHDEEGERYTVIDNRGDSFRIDVFPAGVDCMAYLDGLSPMSGWGERYGIEDLDAKVNRLAESTVCPVLPDPDLSEWDMNRYGYAHSGMLPVGAERAEILFEKVPLHRLYPDGLSAPLQNSWEIGDHAENDGLFGVTVVSWMEHLADAGITRVEDIPLWKALYVPEEPLLEDLAKQARERAAERNTGRPEAPKDRKPPEMGL